MRAGRVLSSLRQEAEFDRAFLKVRLLVNRQELDQKFGLVQIEQFSASRRAQVAQSLGWLYDGSLGGEARWSVGPAGATGAGR